MDSWMIVVDSVRELSCPCVNCGTIGAVSPGLGSSKSSSQALVNFKLHLVAQDGTRTCPTCGYGHDSA